MTVKHRGNKRNASNTYLDSRSPKQVRQSSVSESGDAGPTNLNMHSNRNWSAGPGDSQDDNARVSQI